jgi:membrane protein
VGEPRSDDGRLVTRLLERAMARVQRERRQRLWFDHLVRAGGRYNRMDGDLMAAGITYFAFLSIFPIVLLAASVIGLLLAGDTLLRSQLISSIRKAVPGETGNFLVGQVRDAISASGVTGVVGAVLFVYAGLRTMDKLRIGVRRIWTGRPVEADFLKDNLRDVVSFLALAVVGAVSIALTGGATTATSWLLGRLGLDQVPGISLVTSVSGIALALAADTLVFLWLLKVVAHTRVDLRRLLPGALFGAVGFEILKVLGSLYLALISGSVTASTLGGAVGILVWINLVSRYALFTVSWTAFLPAVRRREEGPADGAAARPDAVPA